LVYHKCFKMCSYCDSRASEPATRALVLETLASMSRIPSVAAEIARYQGAGAWLVSYTCAQGGGAQSHAIARSRLQYPLPLYARPSALAHLAPVLEALQVSSCRFHCTMAQAVRSREETRQAADYHNSAYGKCRSLMGFGLYTA
jgi:hypothetical protein